MRDWATDLLACKDVKSLYHLGCDMVAELGTKDRQLQKAEGDLFAERGAWREAAGAYRDLSVCYRINKPPSEQLFRRLTRARKLSEERE